MKRSGPLKRKTRLKPRSAKNRERQGERDEVRRITLERAGYRCTMAASVPEVQCSWGLPDVDERQGRGVRPGSQYDATQTQTACRAHHRWKHANPKEAVARGVTERSTFERDGMARRQRE